MFQQLIFLTQGWKSSPGAGMGSGREEILLAKKQRGTPESKKWENEDFSGKTSCERCVVGEGLGVRSWFRASCQAEGLGAV